MATPATMDHRFDGDSKILNATLQHRTELRNALAALQQELSRVEGYSTQITAEIKFNVSGPVAKEHVYSVTITDHGFDSIAFARTKTSAGRAASTGMASSPPALNHADGWPISSRRGLDNDEVTEIRPPKRVCLDGEDDLHTPSRSRDAGSIFEDTATLQRVNEVLTFVKNWHDEWTRQGGWLFDTLNGANKAAIERKSSHDKKLDAVQDVLGQSINSASATTMTELLNITKLLPWLEHCRKTNADKVQAREEKWRSSSATFHDQSRRDREAAEKRLEEKLEAQRQLLIKIAESNGVDVDEVDDKQPSRDASLGAQLTAELNLEAARAADNCRKNSNNGPISIDD